MSLKKNAVAVISSGNGGQSLAAYYALHGFAVRLYVREARAGGHVPQPGLLPLRRRGRASAVST